MIMTTQISALGPRQNEKKLNQEQEKMQMSHVQKQGPCHTWSLSIAIQGHLQILPGDQKRAIAFATIFGSKLTEKSQMRAMTRRHRGPAGQFDCWILLVSCLCCLPMECNYKALAQIPCLHLKSFESLNHRVFVYLQRSESIAWFVTSCHIQTLGLYYVSL